MPLKKVTWNFNPEKEITLDSNLEDMRAKIWEETLEEYPGTYDGQLLVLDNIKIKQHALHLNTAFTIFSRIITLEKLKLGFKYGCLGVQALIFSSDKSRILIGQRAEELMYCPLYYGGPGGMLEVADAAVPFTTAAMREIEEEVRIEFQSKYLVAIMKDVYTKVGMCLLIECVISEAVDYNAPIEGNEEWMRKQLKWYNIKELKNFEDSFCLETLIFAKRELLKYQKGSESVIWT
jgi:8-oxo-dGTP pyrophosphatase MutT (NUDIX family)